MNLQFFQINVFTSKPFNGNRVKIELLIEWLADETGVALVAVTYRSLT
ncbi:MAG: hypothetical protein KA746_16225 [Pyrinomonadaceae bacterium]|nr:hypothetical protein [Pyrinomonadaceae bacterium]MBP6213354.1 hypothetical protein [Pyrinomonadaceae bacterium]